LLTPLLVALALAAPAAADPRHDVPEARPAGAGRVALITGDSMMQVIEDKLERYLERGGLPTVRDSRVGTAVSFPSLLNWVTYAAKQARQLREEVTVAFLGANDFRRLDGVRCCGRRWVRAYARRARRMMDAWLRDGAGRVYWLALPRPRPRPLAESFAAVNRGVRRAARRAGDGVTILDLPGAVGGPAHNRKRDGVHLSVKGSRIASELVVDALKRHGFLASSG
jgi:hypothetical protein